MEIQDNKCNNNTDNYQRDGHAVKKPESSASILDISKIKELWDQRPGFTKKERSLNKIFYCLINNKDQKRNYIKNERTSYILNREPSRK